MKSILVAVDGSDEAKRAARLGADIAVRFGAQLTLMNVIPPILTPPDAPGLDLGAFSAEQERAAAKILSDAETELEEPGLTVKHIVAHGAPAETLAREAQKQKVDLVVIGSRGRGAVARVLLGSVSDRLAHISERPILIVR